MTPPPVDDEGPQDSTAHLVLVSPDPSAIHPPGTDVVFDVDTGALGTDPADVAVFLHGVPVPGATVELDGDRLTVANALQLGRNDLRVFARDAAGLALSSADLGATVTSTRGYRYRIVNVVENVDHAIDSEIVLAADRVRLSGRVFVAFREALPIDRDQWVVQGALTRDGTPLGTFRAVDGTSALQVVLDLEGASLPLFTFPY